MAHSLSTLSMRPALPQPPIQNPYYDPPSSAASYSRPLPDPRVPHAHGSVGQWPHSSAGPYQAGSVIGYQPGPPSNGYAHGTMGEFGGPTYPPPTPVGSYSATPDGSQYGGQHSYSDVGHQSSYGAPPQPIGEFEQPANQHRYSTPVPLAQPYGAQAGYHQPPQPPLPPPTPVDYAYGGPPQPPPPPEHLLGRSQSVASFAPGAYSGYPPAPGSAAPPQQFTPAPQGYDSGYSAPPPCRSPYNPPPAQSYTPAPAVAPYNPYTGEPLQPPQPPAPPSSAPPQTNYGYDNQAYGAPPHETYGAPPEPHAYSAPPQTGYPSYAGDYGAPPPPQSYHEPAPPPPPAQGNYLRQQYDDRIQQQHQQPLPVPPVPPGRPASGAAYNPYGWQQ